MGGAPGVPNDPTMFNEWLKGVTGAPGTGDHPLPRPLISISPLRRMSLPDNEPTRQDTTQSKGGSMWDAPNRATVQQTGTLDYTRFYFNFI